jgi:transcriptional regulator with XRE-family HTH domain
MADGSTGARSLADRLEHLFQTVYPRGRGPYSNNEVAEAIKKAGGPKISGTYIWQLRKGIRDNPTKLHLEALAAFFKVRPAYFFDDEEADRTEVGLRLLATLRDTEARNIAARLPGVSPDSLQVISKMLDRLGELEGLPTSAAGQAPAGALDRSETDGANP